MASRGARDRARPSAPNAASATRLPRRPAPPASATGPRVQELAVPRPRCTRRALSVAADPGGRCAGCGGAGRRRRACAERRGNTAPGPASAPVPAGAGGSRAARGGESRRRWPLIPRRRIDSALLSHEALCWRLCAVSAKGPPLFLLPAEILSPGVRARARRNFAAGRLPGPWRIPSPGSPSARGELPASLAVAHDTGTLDWRFYAGRHLRLEPHAATAPRVAPRAGRCARCWPEPG